MKILSIHIGQSRPIDVDGRQMHTGIYKPAVQGPIFLDWLGLAGDEHVNKPFHGGEGRALYGLSNEASGFWRPHLNRTDNSSGLFGENLLFDSLSESEFRVGDVFRLGGTRVQATMPRIPCPIMATRLGLPTDIAKHMLHQSQRPGVLFRVLERGNIAAGDELELLERSQAALRFPVFLKMFEKHAGKVLREDFERLEATPFLPEGFLAIVEKRIVEDHESPTI